MPIVQRGVNVVRVSQDRVKEADKVVSNDPAAVRTAGRPRRDPLKRWKKKYKVDKKTKCFVWQGKLNKYNHGWFYDGERNWDAQQYAWINEHGFAPEGRIRTTCTTPCCVNPAHMYENPPRRKRSKQAMFGREDVIEIRQRYDAGETVVAISKWYHASEKSVGQVARRKTYLWVPEQQEETDASTDHT